MRVTNKSANGFKVDGNNKWFQVDKFKLIKNDKFINLKVNDEIDNIKKNDKNFVIDFDPLHTSEVGELSTHIKSNPRNDSSESFTPTSNYSYKDRQILKGQCLYIAFDGMGKLIEFKDERDRRIQIAQKLLNELEASDYYKW